MQAAGSLNLSRLRGRSARSAGWGLSPHRECPRLERAPSPALSRKRESAPFSWHQSNAQPLNAAGGGGLVVRPFTPTTHAVAYMLWSEAEPLSRLAKAFLNEVRNESARLERTASHQQYQAESD
ncbi:hypothetical protein TM233_04550 [Bradyrhizobium sp. TM233]|nr:hypothetical protein TM233_04550 [Bradyrhizobium sp. TM233]